MVAMTATAKRAELIAGRENKSCDTFFPLYRTVRDSISPTDRCSGGKDRKKTHCAISQVGKKIPEKIHPPLPSFLSRIWQYGRMTQLELEQKKILLLLHAVCNLAKSLFIEGKKKEEKEEPDIFIPPHTSKTHKRWWNDGKAFAKQRISRCKIANKKICNLSKVKFWANKTASRVKWWEWMAFACCSTLNPNEQLILSPMGQRGKQRRRIEQNRRRMMRQCRPPSGIYSPLKDPWLIEILPTWKPASLCLITAFNGFERTPLLSSFSPY